MQGKNTASSDSLTSSKSSCEKVDGCAQRPLPCWLTHFETWEPPTRSSVSHERGMLPSDEGSWKLGPRGQTSLSGACCGYRSQIQILAFEVLQVYLHKAMYTEIHSLYDRHRILSLGRFHRHPGREDPCRGFLRRVTSGLTTVVHSLRPLPQLCEDNEEPRGDERDSPFPRDRLRGEGDERQCQMRKSRRNDPSETHVVFEDVVVDYGDVDDREDGEETQDDTEVAGAL